MFKLSIVFGFVLCICFFIGKIFSSMNKEEKKEIKELEVKELNLKENGIKVFEFLYLYDDKNLTAADVAEGTGLEKRQVDGIFTSAIQRKCFGFREEAEIEIEGKEKAVKYLKLGG